MDYFDMGEAVISIDHWATGGTVFTNTTDRVAGRADFTRNAGHLTVEDLIRLTQEENDAMDDIAEDSDDKTAEAQAEAAAMLARTAKLLGFATGTELTFNDTDGQPDWAAEGIAFVSGLIDAQSGTPVMQGTGGGAFSPLTTYTVQQAILTALRLFHCK